MSNKAKESMIENKIKLKLASFITKHYSTHKDDNSNMVKEILKSD